MWQSIRKIGIEIYCFITAPIVLKNCLSILAIIGAMILTSTYWMQCYTTHGETIEVPELSGVSYKEAKKKASRHDLDVAIADSIYQIDKPAGLVILQDPKPGDRVKENRTIYLTVTKNNPDLLKLPSLRGNDDFERYSKTLKSLGLKPRITSTVFDEKLEQNTIVTVQYRGEDITRKIDIGAGVQVNMGEFIDFVVSSGAEGLVAEVPDLGCMTLDAAREALQPTGKTIKSIQHIGQITREDDAYVLRYNVNGDEIDVYVVQKRPATCPE
jgi:beta-lactam-binding protein with PASTA domain